MVIRTVVVVMICLTVAACSHRQVTYDATRDVSKILNPVTPEMLNNRLPAPEPRYVYLVTDPKDAFTEQMLKRQLLGSTVVLTDRKNSDLVLTITTNEFSYSDDGSDKEVISFARYNVQNIAAAVMMMPDNSTYSFDAERRTATGSYRLAYTIKTPKGKVVGEDAISNSIQRSAIKCSSPRITNVFGGVAPATFWASDKMQAECTANQPAPTKEYMRKEVEAAVADSLKNAIAAVHLSAK